MKRAVWILHCVVVWLLTVVLVGLCLWQWRKIDEAQSFAKEENLARLTAEGQRDAANIQIDGLSSSLLKAEQRSGQIDLERRKLALVRQVLENELKLRDKQIQRLAASVDEARGRLGAASELLQDASSIETAVAERDAIIRQLQTEREQLANQLNERTRQYNELVEKVK